MKQRQDAEEQMDTSNDLINLLLKKISDMIKNLNRRIECRKEVVSFVQYMRKVFSHLKQLHFQSLRQQMRLFNLRKLMRSVMNTEN